MDLQPVKKSMVAVVIAYFVAIVLGALAGYCNEPHVMAAAHFISTVFVRLFKFLAIPIICVSVISSLSTLAEQQESGKIFRHTILYTLLTTVLAAGIAALLYLIFEPANVSVASASNEAVANIAGKSYIDYLQSVIPDNFVTPFQTANVLSVLLIAAAVGIAISRMPKGSRQDLMINFFAALQQVLFVMVNWLIVALPVGIFGFVAVLAQELSQGVDMGGLGTYFGIVIGANLVQMFLVLPLFLLAKGLHPFKVARGMMPALTLAFFSKSSAGTLPVTIASSENNLQVNPKVARFVLPICTTINMNGCAAFIFLTVIYLMQNAGIPITAGTIVAWIFIATLAAIGNAGVPMGCFFLSASLLASMNVPILLLGVILPFYAVVDMIETALNVWSDSTVAAAVNKDLGFKADHQLR